MFHTRNELISNIHAMRSEFPATATKPLKGGNWVRAFGLSSCALLLAGCGDSRELLPLNPVSGRVLAENAPLAGAMVVFYPVGGSEQLQVLRPRGKTNANGEFQLQTYLPGDGAPVGEFKVTIRWHGEPVPEDSEDERHDAGDLRPNLLLETYAEPAHTPLKVTIANGENALEPFQVELTPQT